MAEGKGEPICSNRFVSLIYSHCHRSSGCLEHMLWVVLCLLISVSSGFAAVILSFYMASRRMREQRSLEMNYWLRARVITQGKHPLFSFHISAPFRHSPLSSPQASRSWPCHGLRAYGRSSSQLQRKDGPGSSGPCPRPQWVSRKDKRHGKPNLMNV